jgi:hypothetical protein
VAIGIDFSWGGGRRGGGGYTKDWKELAGAASDAGSYALSKGKSLVSKVASKGLGVVGMMLDATPTSSTDQPGTGTHGGEKRNWGFKNPPPDEK